MSETDTNNAPWMTLADRLEADAPLTLTDVAEYLQRETRTVTRYVKSDGLPVHRPGGRDMLFFRSEVDAWIRSRCSDRTPDQTTRPPTSSTVAA